MGLANQRLLLIVAALSLEYVCDALDNGAAQIQPTHTADINLKKKAAVDDMTTDGRLKEPGWDLIPLNDGHRSSGGRTGSEEDEAAMLKSDGPAAASKTSARAPAVERCSLNGHVSNTTGACVCRAAWQGP